MIAFLKKHNFLAYIVTVTMITVLAKYPNFQLIKGMRSHNLLIKDCLVAVLTEDYDHKP